MKNESITFYKQLLQDAVTYAEKAVALLKSYEKTFIVAKQKEEFDFATNADNEAEELMEKFIHPLSCNSMSSR